MITSENFESNPPRRLQQLAIDRRLRTQSDMPFRLLRRANPLTQEFLRALDAALALDSSRASAIIARRFKRLQHSKSWKSYEQLRGNGTAYLPINFLWMRRLEELAGLAKQTVSTAQQVRAVYKK